MKKVLLFIVALLTLAGFGQGIAVADDCGHTNINFLGGQKQLDSDWKPNDTQDELGATVDVSGKGWPISLEFGYIYTTQKGNADEIIGDISFDNLESNSFTEEGSVGIKKIWPNDNGLNFSLSGGAALVKGSVTFGGAANTTFDNSKVGWYGAGSLYFTVANFLNLGVYGRYSDVKLDLGPREVNAGGWHYGVLAGLHF